MYLKKLEIQGFKSFPEYTLIEFDQGMTAVVGPNGSGKSNVTDAIRWVLGEQSVKTLRGGKMEDVIFNGTQSRKAMNYAEVSLTFDNNDHFLDYDYGEIQITRRLYRSGESEYQINHVNCRLKDIVGLFLDTGLGKDGYSIVGQGRVDEILSTKSEDRRRVIEEASGIVKFKVRKDEAERKLNSTEQNLVRIDDILNELSERIEPLKEQSEKAIAYHKAYESLKEQDIALLVRRIDDANNAMGDSGSVKEKLEAEIKEQEDRYIEFRQNNSTLTQRSEELDDKIEDKRQELSDVTEEMHDTVSDIKINEERLRQLNDNIENSATEEKELIDDIEKLRNDYAERIAKADELLDRANTEKKNTEEIISQRDEILEEFRNSEKSNDSIRKSIESKTNELLDTKEKITSASAQISAMEDRLRELGNNRQVSAGLKTEMETKLKEADGAWREMMEKEGEVTSDITTRDEKLKELSKEESKLLADYEADNRSFISDKARLKSLQDLEARKEGYQESVRRLFNEVGENSHGIVGVIGDLISTKKEYETAIEIALASAIHNVVTKTEKNAADLIDVLKTKRLGRVTFLPIENIKPRSIDRNVVAGCERKHGYIGVASDLVDNPKEIDDIVRNLLGKILICETMEDARVIAREASHSVKVITLDGDCINAGGSLTGGSIRKDSAGILGRAREIEDLKSRIVKTEQKLSVSEARRQELDEQTGDIKREIAQLNEQLKFFMTADRFLDRAGELPEYAEMYARFDRSLPEALVSVEKAADPFAAAFAAAHKDDPLHYFVGAGTLWGATYSYAMCFWEEMHWLRSKSIHAAELFHGTLEVIGEETPVTLFIGEDAQRPLGERAARFLAKVNQNYTIIDTKNYELPGIDTAFRGAVSHLVMRAVTGRIDVHLEALTGHDMRLRRYYRKLNY